MPYRDELVQLTQTLAEKSAALEATSERAAILEREREEMRREVDALSVRVERARRRLSMFEDVRVASPCSEPWANMEGDDRSRFCQRCEKQVFNLSGMTTAEIDRFMAETTGSPCIRFYRRADGTMLTQDCVVGKRSRRVHQAVAAIGIGAALATVGTMGLGAMFMTQGKMADRPTQGSEAERGAALAAERAELEAVTTSERAVRAPASAEAPKAPSAPGVRTQR